MCASSSATKPVAACLLGTHGIPGALGSLREGHLPSYRFPEAAVIALSHAARYGEWLRRPEGSYPEIGDVSIERARAAFAAKGMGGPAGRWLEPEEVRGVLTAYDHRSDGEQTFAVHRITAVRAVAESSGADT